MNILYYDVLEVDEDTLYLLVSESGWVAISAFNEEPATFLSQYPNRLFSKERVAPYKQELKEYLAGKRTLFTHPIELEGKGTPFQREVWQALQQIPYGQTRTYGDIAKMIKRPKAVRAVGTAIGHNPLRLVIPCHRVIRSDGSLGQYNGGTQMKRYLQLVEGIG